ncbi:hypothetical protein FVA74_05660 [Salinibacterium sp. dk2585]|uniref:hypothetical protein n=1 Tax=unclassified Salinibacterium TaxID=2632331 RepID=UPI0011C24ACB|nr:MULTISPECIES: hypothetical protein [unclassified Salinibacterium]QEE61117.1 hypothetical protein FVA74_05660 [Salinibacterium sp. dk2585]TXK53060.1 hypothetical protein FVP63_11780 [Salinibacterium sp. dk5596]
MSHRWDALRSWHHDWAGLRVMMVGLDTRGFAVADTLTELGADVTVVSEGEHSSDLAQLVDVIGARLIVGLQEAEDLVAQWRPDVLVVSAGSTEHPLVQWADEEGVPVASDIELAWRLRDKNGEPAPWLLTAGGSEAGRAAHLTEAMLLAAGARAMACGDTTAGVPVLDALRVPEQWECLVVAVSAEDLRYSPSVAAWSAACLTSGTGAAVDLLGRVYEGAQVACVYNRADDATMHMVEEAEVEEGCRAIGFGAGIPGPSDFGVVEGILCDRAFLEERRESALEFGTVDMLDAAGLATASGLNEVLAAAALARSFGAPISALNAALRGLGTASE